jgi:hypothetical protein
MAHRARTSLGARDRLSRQQISLLPKQSGRPSGLRGAATVRISARRANQGQGRRYWRAWELLLRRVVMVCLHGFEPYPTRLRKLFDYSGSKAATLPGLLACLLAGLAMDGRAAVPPANGGPSAFSPPFAIADFDGDSKPDLATVQVRASTASQARYRIEFELSAGERQIVMVTGPIGGLEIAPRDVTGDQIPDLVVTTTLLNQPVAVLVNDGRGNFTLREAAAFPGMVWRYERFWSLKKTQIRDTTALVRAAGLCRPARDLAEYPWRPGRLRFSQTDVVALDLASAVRGRAPPTAVFHV